MPPWPGGPCPSCGEEMPERLIHCRTCRTLLNTDLDPDSVEIPAFVPLQEIETVAGTAGSQDTTCFARTVPASCASIANSSVFR